MSKTPEIILSKKLRFIPPLWNESYPALKRLIGPLMCLIIGPDSELVYLLLLSYFVSPFQTSQLSVQISNN